ncbi:MAG: hypothetical protein ACRDH2_14365 [Anaerolineales bacterium]
MSFRFNLQATPRLARLAFAAWISLSACAAPEGATGAPSQFTDLNGDLSVENLERFVQATAESTAPQALSLPDAQAQLPFTLALPAWVPEGFTRQEAVEVVMPSGQAGYAAVNVTWQNGEEATITLQAATALASVEQPQLGGVESIEPITVNGQPATLGRGSRLRGERLSLAWTRDSVTYTLTSDVVTAQALVQMAESVP